MSTAESTSQSKRFVVCISRGKTPVTLVIGKVYEQLEDDQAAAVGMLRIVDESGEDYLYPMRQFRHLP
jgi:hypothetical protein